MATAMEKKIAELEQRAANATRRARESKNTLERALVRKAGVLGSAAMYGTFNRLGVPLSIGGFPWKVGVGAIALLGEGMTGGNTQAVMGGIADATLAIYVERAISQNTLIAGYESVGAEDEEDGDEL